MAIKTAVRPFLVSCCALATLAGVRPAPAQVTIDEFPVPTGGSRPYTIVAGPDGGLWFTESIGNKIGRISAKGQFFEFDVPTGKSGPYGIAVGPDGNIWFTERFADQIGRLDIFSHQITEFPIPTPFAQAWEIAPGADGNLWFTEEDVDQIGMITTDGAVMMEVPTGTFGFPTGIAPGGDGNMWFTIEIGDMIGQITPVGQLNTFPYSQNQTLPWDITPGPDGNLWFSELAGRAIGRITTAGDVVEHPIPGDFSGIAGVSTGWDGNIWYTENDTNLVGSIDLDGTVLPKYDTGLRPLSITAGPDGNMWFTIADGNAIGRINIAEPGAGHVISMDGGFSPRRRLMKMGNTAKWMFIGPRAHSVVDTSGLGLFDSGTKTMVSYFNHVFTAASTYPYHDGEPGGTLEADIRVPVDAPPTATVNAPFPVVWATTSQGPDIVFDVQVRVPDAPDYTDWQTTPNFGDHYTAPTPGQYRFRARMRNTVTGAATIYSPPAAVNVEEPRPGPTVRSRAAR
jgi:streptogramin lyase